MKKITLTFFALSMILSFSWAQTGKINLASEEINTPFIKGMTAGQAIETPAYDLKGVLDTTNLIYDNGPLINSPGTGAGGKDESKLQGSLGMTSYGAGHAVSSGYRVGDDFIVPVGETWQINGFTFYAYQTGSGTTSTLNNVNFRIYSNVIGTGTVVFGDATTNRLTFSNFSNIYRVTETTSLNTDRPIMKSHCNVSGLTLTEGTYWIDWQTGGTSTSGPWAPPITINGQTSTGNAKQYDPATLAWGVLNDGGSLTPQGLPFKIYGSIIVGVNEVQKVNTVKVYPNPATDVLNVAAGEMIQKITMLNYIGQKVYESAAGDKTAQINTSVMEKGMYFVIVETSKGKTTQKVAVE